MLQLAVAVSRSECLACKLLEGLRQSPPLLLDGSVLERPHPLGQLVILLGTPGPPERADRDSQSTRMPTTEKDQGRVCRRSTRRRALTTAWAMTTVTTAAMSKDPPDEQISSFSPLTRLHDDRGSCWLFSGGLSADERRHLEGSGTRRGLAAHHVHRASYNRPLSFRGGRVEDKAQEDRTTERIATETGPVEARHPLDAGRTGGGRRGGHLQVVARPAQVDTVTFLGAPSRSALRASGGYNPDRSRRGSCSVVRSGAPTRSDPPTLNPWARNRRIQAP